MIEDLDHFLRKHSSRLSEELKENQVCFFIEDFLRILGWGIKEKSVEPTVDSKREPDYLLTDRDGKLTLIVEVKRPNRLKRETHNHVRSFSELVDELTTQRDREDVRKAFHEYA